MKPWIIFLVFSLQCLGFAAHADSGKLLVTAGLTQVEGSGGGGLTPWATMAGYETRDGHSASIFSTRVEVDDYRLLSQGLALSFKDRMEFSFARQTFDLKTLGGEIEQDIFGAKIRLLGDVVYSSYPQISAGLQHKRLKNGAVAQALGADKFKTGTDFYLAASKVHLGLLYGYSVVWNLTGRATKANEMGLLGHGGVRGSDYELMLEGSLGVLLAKNWVAGIEYRQKPDNLGLGEDNWRDLFVAYIPNKHFNATLAYADLGSIAGASGQRGLYLSLTGYLW